MGDEIGPDFEEADYPGLAITSRPRRQTLGTFADVYREAYGSDALRPPTLIVPQLIDRFFDLDAGQLSEAFIEAIDAIFEDLSGGKPLMDKADVDAWILTINRAPGRGSELRRANDIFEARGEQGLSAEDPRAIYEGELREGRPWGVHHDLQALGHGLAVISSATCEACLDRIYHSRDTLEALALRERLTQAQRQRIDESGDALPNAWHPSDHLPLAAVFRFR